MTAAYQFTSHEEIEGIKGGVIKDVWEASTDPAKTCIGIYIENGNDAYTLMFDEEGPWHHGHSALCESCKGINELSSRYCTKCGTKLPEREEQQDR